MKTISDVLAKVFNNDISGKATGYLRLNSKWQDIVEEAFTSKDRITAKKAAEHSRISYIKNNVLFIETDHQGWVQILQTVQKRIISLLNKKYSDVSINAIAFLLPDNNVDKLDAKTLKNSHLEDNIEISDYNSVEKNIYKNIKNEKLKKVLMCLGTRINAGL
jgi:hypothetical protein